MSNNLHEGHRERVLKEFLENGFNEKTPEHKMLELLLFYSIPRKDTNELAHLLIDTFGSLDAVLEAPVEQLVKVKGIGEKTAALIKLILPFASRYTSKKINDKKEFRTSDQLGEFLIAKYMGFTKETFAITSLNAKGKFLGFDVLSIGDVTSVELSVRRVIETVIKRNPACVVMSHNHPAGSALPSADDIRLTANISDTLENINVKLLDHIILCNNDYVSMSQSKEFDYIFRK